jgi:hypothetical protein
MDLRETVREGVEWTGNRTHLHESNLYSKVDKFSPPVILLKSRVKNKIVAFVDSTAVTMKSPSER